MSLKPYLNIQTSTNYQFFEFESIGKMHAIKRVKFDLIDEDEQIYNLALCTVLPDGTEDCESASRNGDMITILETVAHIGLIYTDRFPERKIFFMGSDLIRSRKYQMGLSNNLNDILVFFAIEGIVIDNNQIILRETFQKGRSYTGFIFTRKP